MAGNLTFNGIPQQPWQQLYAGFGGMPAMPQAAVPVQPAGPTMAAAQALTAQPGTLAQKAAPAEGLAAVPAIAEKLENGNFPPAPKSQAEETGENDETKKALKTGAAMLSSMEFPKLPVQGASASLMGAQLPSGGRDQLSSVVSDYLNPNRALAINAYKGFTY